MSAPGEARPRVYLFYGADEVAKRGALETLLAELIRPEERALNLEELDAAQPQVDVDRVLRACGDVGMFAERRVVLVWNAAGLWPPRLKTAADRLAEGLEQLGEVSCLILVLAAPEEARPRRAPVSAKLLKAVKQWGEAREFRAPKGAASARRAQAEAARLEKALSDSVARLLVERVGDDSTRLLGEVGKLAAYLGGEREITAAAVQAIVPRQPEDNVFRLLDAVFAGERRKALDLLADLRTGGLNCHQLTPMLARGVRALMVAKHLQDHGVRAQTEREDVPEGALRDFPTDHGLYRRNFAWKRRQVWGQARRLSWEQLGVALDRLAGADAGSKGWEGGLADGELAMDLWIVSLAGGGTR